MSQQETPENRRPILCPKCGKPMVFMNKYNVFKDKKKKAVSMWYICPKRKDRGEEGCGYKAMFI